MPTRLINPRTTQGRTLIMTFCTLTPKRNLVCVTMPDTGIFFEYLLKGIIMNAFPHAMTNMDLAARCYKDMHR